jgi:hypothetical protein
MCFFTREGYVNGPGRRVPLSCRIDHLPVARKTRSALAGCDMNTLSAVPFLSARGRFPVRPDSNYAFILLRGENAAREESMFPANKTPETASRSVTTNGLLRQHAGIWHPAIAVWAMLSGWTHFKNYSSVNVASMDATCRIPSPVTFLLLKGYTCSKVSTLRNLYRWSQNHS